MTETTGYESYSSSTSYGGYGESGYGYGVESESESEFTSTSTSDDGGYGSYGSRGEEDETSSDSKCLSGGEIVRSLGRIEKSLCVLTAEAGKTTLNLSKVANGESNDVFDGYQEFENRIESLMGKGQQQSDELGEVLSIFGKLKEKESSIQKVQTSLLGTLKGTKKKYEVSKKCREVMLKYQAKSKEYDLVLDQMYARHRKFDQAMIEGKKLENGKKEHSLLLEKKGRILKELRKLKKTLKSLEGFEVYKREAELSERDRDDILVERRRNSNNFERCFVCPITQFPFEDPVMLVESGNTYSRKAIVEWLSRKKTDPLTNKVLSDTTLVPNTGIKAATAEWLTFICK